MSLIEAVRQGAIVAAEFAALLTVTPAHATPSEIVLTLSSPASPRRLTASHALAGPLMLDGLRPLALLRSVEAIETADDDDFDEPCGPGDADEDDDDQPEAHVVVDIDEAIADRSLTALVVERARAAARNP